MSKECAHTGSREGAKALRCEEHKEKKGEDETK